MMNLTPYLSSRRNGGALARRDNAFETLQREIDRLFDSMSGATTPAHGGHGQVFPSLDVSETDKEIKITCELPGIEEKDVQLSLTDNVLTIRGEKRTESEDKDKAYYHNECSYGAFSRQVELPSHVDASQLKASMKHGVLRITAPKRAEAGARKIEIRPE
jgi:HSP20 family protein